MIINSSNTTSFIAGTSGRPVQNKSSVVEKDGFSAGKSADDLQVYKPLQFEGKKEVSINQVASSDMSLGISAGADVSSSPVSQALKNLDIIYTNDIHGAITPAKDDKNPGLHIGG